MSKRSSPVQTVAGGSSWKQVSCGYDHTLAIKIDGTLWAWGFNNDGELGIGDTTKRSSPVQVGTDANWAFVSAGSFHSHAIKTNGTLWSWGINFRGNLGDGTTIDRSSPVQVGTFTWLTVAAGEEESIAVRADNTLWVWGRNHKGQLGDGTIIDRSSPVQAGSLANWRYVDAGEYFTVALLNSQTGRTGGSYPDLDDIYVRRDLFIEGNIWGSGLNAYGFLGNASTTNVSSPVQTAGSYTNWKQIPYGSGHHAASVRSDGTLWAWGRNEFGQLGDGTTINKSTPIQVGSLTDWKFVSADYPFTIAVKIDGSLWTCGYNTQGQLGDGTTVRKSSPVQVGALKNWKHVAAFEGWWLAIKTDGTLWSCGQNDGTGKLGDGTTVSKSSPVQIGALTDWESICLGGTGSTGFAIKKDGTLWGWGANSFGQLGDGTTVRKSSPVQIGTDANWKQVSAAGRHTMAIKKDGSLWGWGANSQGHLGDGTTVDKSSPIQIGTLKNWKRVAAGGDTDGHTHAVKTDGTLWSWGTDSYGQHGIPSLQGIDLSSPVQVGALTYWRDVSCGYDSFFAFAEAPF